MVLGVFMVYVKAKWSSGKPYVTVCQRKANLSVLPNILAIKQLQWERAKTVLVQRGIEWFRALRICSHSQYMFTYSRLLSLRLPALTFYPVRGHDRRNN